MQYIVFLKVRNIWKQKIKTKNISRYIFDYGIQCICSGSQQTCETHIQTETRRVRNMKPFALVAFLQISVAQHTYIQGDRFRYPTLHSADWSYAYLARPPLANTTWNNWTFGCWWRVANADMKWLGPAARR